MFRILFPPFEGAALCFEFIALLCVYHGVQLVRANQTEDGWVLLGFGALVILVTHLSALLPDIPTERELRWARDNAPPIPEPVSETQDTIEIVYDESANELEGELVCTS